MTAGRCPHSHPFDTKRAPSMTAPHGKTPVPGSERAPLDRPAIADVPGNEVIDVLVTLRPDVDSRTRDRVVKFLEDHGLTVESVYDRTKTLHVRGPAAGMQMAFSVKYIDSCDLLLLFWSTAAKCSP